MFFGLYKQNFVLVLLVKQLYKCLSFWGGGIVMCFEVFLVFLEFLFCALGVCFFFCVLFLVIIF